MPAIHHIRLNVTDLNHAKAFYTPILSWLGFADIGKHTDRLGNLERLRWAKDGTIFLLSQAASKTIHDPCKIGLHHLAFSVDSSEAVDRFYNEVLLKLSTVRIEDPPVDCPEYQEGYYATFFFDPDGLKLEVTYSP